MAECPKNKPKGLMARSYRLTKTSFVQYFHLMLRIACLCPTQPKSPRSRVQREIYQWQEPIISMIAAFLITRWRGWQRVGRPKSPKCSDLCGFSPPTRPMAPMAHPIWEEGAGFLLTAFFPRRKDWSNSCLYFFRMKTTSSLMLFKKCSLHRHIPVFDWFLYHLSWLAHLTKFHW